MHMVTHRCTPMSISRADGFDPQHNPDPPNNSPDLWMCMVSLFHLLSFKWKIYIYSKFAFLGLIKSIKVYVFRIFWDNIDVDRLFHPLLNMRLWDTITTGNGVMCACQVSCGCFKSDHAVDRNKRHWNVIPYSIIMMAKNCRGFYQTLIFP